MVWIQNPWSNEFLAILRGNLGRSWEARPRLNLCLKFTVLGGGSKPEKQLAALPSSSGGGGMPAFRFPEWVRGWWGWCWGVFKRKPHVVWWHICLASPLITLSPTLISSCKESCVSYNLKAVWALGQIHLGRGLCLHARVCHLGGLGVWSAKPQTQVGAAGWFSLPGGKGSYQRLAPNCVQWLIIHPIPPAEIPPRNDKMKSRQAGMCYQSLHQPIC